MSVAPVVTIICLPVVGDVRGRTHSSVMYALRLSENGFTYCAGPQVINLVKSVDEVEV